MQISEWSTMAGRHLPTSKAVTTVREEITRHYTYRKGNTAPRTLPEESGEGENPADRDIMGKISALHRAQCKQSQRSHLSRRLTGEAAQCWKSSQTLLRIREVTRPALLEAREETQSIPPCCTSPALKQTPLTAQSAYTWFCAKTSRIQHTPGPCVSMKQEATSGHTG